MNNLIQKLLFQNKKQWQLIAAIIGTFLGLFLVLSATQIYTDLQQLLYGKNSDTTQYVIINKKVNLFNTLGVRSTFSEKEISTIESLDFVEKTAAFVPNLYRVSASSETLGFYTELFFEAVEDAFIDVESSAWAWEEGQGTLPVILSKDYLALYNFGFAPSQGLPQFTPSTIGRVSLDINIGRRPHQKTFRGSVVGFSDRINSILVPMPFMQWANENYGNGKTKAPSRLMLKTNQANNQALSKYLEENGYEISSGRLISTQAASILQKILGLFLLIGLVIFVLSVIVFILNYQLFIAQSNEDIRLLLQLGHPTKTIVQMLFRKLAVLFLGIVCLSLVGLYLLRWSSLPWLRTQGFDLNNMLHPFVFLVALLIIVSFLGINFQTIKKSVQTLF